MQNQSSEQNDLLAARILDALRLAEIRRRPHFVGFLDERETVRAKNLLRRESFVNAQFWGGFPEAERVVLGAFPDFMTPDASDFPVTALTVEFRKQDRLTHRDFLGALLHTGLERSSLGDILTEEGRAVIFCRREVSGFLCSQVEKIGGVGVRITEGAQEPLPAAHRFADFSAVIASARLDCVTAAAVGTSREKAAAMIRARLVELNHEEETSPSADVHEGDILSVRGEGRFVIDRLGPPTKKGRLGISGRKYV
jgi:RNA-binding protein YlmH